MGEPEQSRTDREPYAGRGFQIEGGLVVDRRPLSVFGLMQAGQRIATVTLAELVRAGYAYTETVSRVETSAYSLRTNKLVWSALTKTVGDEAGELLEETSEVVASQLTKRGLAG